MTIIILTLIAMLFVFAFYLLYKTEKHVEEIANIKKFLSVYEHKQVMAKKDLDNWDLHQKSILTRVMKQEQLANANAREWNQRFIDTVQKISLLEPRVLLLETVKNAGS